MALSCRDRPDRHWRVPHVRAFCVNRLCALFGIALVLVFAAASLSVVVDAIQHAPGASPEHEHSLFSDASLMDDHTAEHGGGDGQEDGTGDRADHLPGGHQHHTDSGSGLPALPLAGGALVAAGRDLLYPAPDTPRLGLSIAGPRRPPRSIANQG